MLLVNEHDGYKALLHIISLSCFCTGAINSSPGGSGLLCHYTTCRPPVPETTLHSRINTHTAVMKGYPTKSIQLVNSSTFVCNEYHMSCTYAVQTNVVVTVRSRIR
jgi:hypothetical protein